MGLTAQPFRFIIDEHKRSRLKGDGLLIGRHTTGMSMAESLELLRQENLSAWYEHPSDKVDNTRNGAGKNYVSDYCLFSLLSPVLRLHSLDVSDYEGAEILHDLNEPIPADMEESADFVYNGSCLDNIFDPVTALTNTAKLCRVGGRIVGMEAFTEIPDAYLKFSPAYIYDYFMINLWHVRVYCAYFPIGGQDAAPWTLYEWNPVIGQGQVQWLSSRIVGPECMLLYSATRRKESTCDRKPIQWHYRSETEHAEYYELAVRNEYGVIKEAEIEVPYLPFRSPIPNLRFVRNLMPAPAL